MSRALVIDSRVIDDDSDCFVVAEIGHNHQGNLELAKEMFQQAKLCGADAVKLQKRDNKSLFTKELYDKPYDNENSFGATYGEHREALEFGADEYRELQRFATEIGITFFATAFDIPSADFLADLDMPAFKLASGDLTTTPLLRHIASLGKPVLISTGGGRMEDVERAYETVAPINDQLCIMQCTAGYPCDFQDMNLRVIETFRRRFSDIVIGLSSHDNGIAMALAGYILGARVVEKHFTLNRAMKGTDQAFSLEPVGMRKLVRDIRRARSAFGDGTKRPCPTEGAALSKMAKKIVAARDIPAGHVVTREDIAMKSPNDGLPPFEDVNVIGKKTARDLARDENIEFEDLVDA